MSKTTVGILMGSKSDWSVMRSVTETLDQFGVDYSVNVLSAHRTPHAVAEYSSTAADRGLQVIIAGAGCAAHLAGAVAAQTILPVIGVPLKGGAMDGLDSLLATVQMPKGVPVATVALGKAGAINAALLAVQIMSLSDEELQTKLLAFKQDQRNQKFDLEDLDA